MYEIPKHLVSAVHEFTVDQNANDPVFAEKKAANYWPKQTTHFHDREQR